ncbi:MAG: amidase [Verrucomicrobia bacterium]|nr:amidase [Verrucomicrobiota bacterium]MDA1068428.1 amidase [Verrucomicrobiota bacterium]
MSPDIYWSISEWSHHSKSDPQKAADHFFNHLNRFPKAQVRAAIARIPSREHLIQAFEKSIAGPGLPLAGAPYLLKDLYDVAGWETNASSHFLNEVRSTPKTSSALARAFDHAGGVFAGKTHLVEFAFGMEGSNCHFGDGVHPLFPNRISGGSSSGSVWAVAGGLVPLASGSDTGGSVRVPAAYNGLYGLRVTPTHPWSKDGCWPLSPSFDTAGWFTRTAADMAITIDALFAPGSDEQAKFKGLDLLPHYAFIDEGLSAPHRQTIDAILASTNSEATKAFLSLPDLVKAYLVISSNEAFGVHKEWHENRKDQYDPQTWDRIAKGKQWSIDDLNEAFAVKNQMSKWLNEWFLEYDYIVLPASPVPAPLLGEGTVLREANLALTAPASLAGLPVLTIPYFMESGLSGGLQIIVPDLSPRSIAVWKRLLYS